MPLEISEELKSEMQAELNQYYELYDTLRIGSSIGAMNFGEFVNYVKSKQSEVSKNTTKKAPAKKTRQEVLDEMDKK